MRPSQIRGGNDITSSTLITSILAEGGNDKSLTIAIADMRDYKYLLFQACSWDSSSSNSYISINSLSYAPIFSNQYVQWNSGNTRAGASVSLFKSSATTNLTVTVHPKYSGRLSVFGIK